MNLSPEVSDILANGATDRLLKIAAELPETNFRLSSSDLEYILALVTVAGRDSVYLSSYTRGYKKGKILDNHRHPCNIAMEILGWLDGFGDRLEEEL